MTAQQTTQQTATKLSDDFDRLMENMTQLLSVCADALSPGKSQQERNKVRDAITEYLKVRAE